jgi:hydroxymethylpyrimidine/phosphomethylpyrimidine kinase
MKRYKHYYKALTIAGSDSGGGAGIQADLKTFSANGVFGMSAITAITAQNTKGVVDIHPIPTDIIRKQIEAVVEDMGADAVKIGMLHSSVVIRTVVESLRKYDLKNIVVDPVMVSTSGHKLLQDEAIETLIREMLPEATIITPNLPEAEIILDRKIETPSDFKKAAKDLAETGARAVLLKAGHFKSKELLDTLFIPESNELVEIPVQKVETENTHGTGCTLSSAIAAHLAQGISLKESIKKGVEYIHQSIVEGAQYKIGHGHGPVHHFYKFWN